MLIAGIYLGLLLRVHVQLSGCCAAFRDLYLDDLDLPMRVILLVSKAFHVRFHMLENPPAQDL